MNQFHNPQPLRAKGFQNVKKEYLPKFLYNSGYHTHHTQEMRLTPYVYYTTRKPVGMQDLYELEPTKRYEAIFSTLHIEPLLFAVSKKTVYGAPTKINYPAQ